MRNIDFIRDAIKSTNGQFFTAEFYKKDGTLRKMNCRVGVKKHLRGGNSTTKGKENLITVFDTDVGEYRCINMNTIQSLKMFGQEFKF